jgi:hypothetical protein
MGSYFPLYGLRHLVALDQHPHVHNRTFLLVALLQHTQRSGEHAIHLKLDAIADGMADLMNHFDDDNNELRNEIEDLKAAVGLEEKA